MHLNYQFGGLETGAGAIATSVKQLLEKQNELQSAVRGLQLDWDSESARQSWDAKQRQWDAAELAAREALDAFGRAVHQSGVDMRATDHMLANKFGH